MTQTNPTMPSNASSPSDDDPLLHLHKMSTTAGLGSQDYVAVNVTSVIAILFGLASLLAIASPVLLVFPVVGVILSWTALRQVKNSNGTQTGAGLAILGLILSGVITALIFSYQGLQVWHRRADDLALSALSQKYGEYLNQHNYVQAYDLFDADFQNRVSKPQFIGQLSLIQGRAPLMPPIDSVSWNGLAVYQTNDDGSETADSVIKVHFKGMEGDARSEARFRRDAGGQWLFDNIPDHFPAQRPAGQAAAKQQ
jgi:hypothetical protein